MRIVILLYILGLVVGDNIYNSRITEPCYMPYFDEDVAEVV